MEMIHNMHGICDDALPLFMAMSVNKSLIVLHHFKLFIFNATNVLKEKWYYLSYFEQCSSKGQTSHLQKELRLLPLYALINVFEMVLSFDMKYIRLC